MRQPPRWRGLVAAALLLGGFAACQDDATGPQDARVAIIELSPAFDTLTALGETIRLTAVARDAGGVLLDRVTFEWSSSNTAVVTVVSGNATAVSGGAATVTVSAGDASAEARIHVIQEGTSAEVSPAEWTATWVGAKLQFEAIARDANGHPVPDVAFEWTSLDPDKVEISESGIATAKASGASGIVAAHEDLADSAAVSIHRGGFDPGPPEALAYTVWFPRSERAPVVLMDDSLVVLHHPDGDRMWFDIALEPIDLPHPSPWGLRNVGKFHFDGDNLGLLTDVVGGTGTLRFRPRVGEWRTLEVGTISDFDMRYGRVVALDGSGVLRSWRAGEGWVLLDTNVEQFAMGPGGPRVAWVRGDGVVRVKNDLTGEAWTAYEGGGIDRVFLTSTVGVTSSARVGVLLDDGSFRLKKGRFGEWVVIAEGGAREARMESIFDATRVALLFEDGSLRAQDVPDGPVASSGELVTLWDGADDILQFELERDRVAFLTSGDQLVTYDSGLDGVGAGSSARGAREFQLQGDMMGWLTGDGRLEVREGDGPFVSSQPIPGEVSQFRLLAHVPHPPVRTFVEDYVGALANCDPDGVTGCVSPPYLNAAVPLYGRFCGKDWPESWTGAHAAGPIDGLDALCHHHDHAGRWYGLGGDWWELDVHVEAACVVRWGLHNSRLTRDGAILAEGRDGWSAWDAAWGSNMPNLKDAVDRYLEITAICGDDRLSGFDRDTAAEYYYR